MCQDVDILYLGMIDRYMNTICLCICMCVVVCMCKVHLYALKFTLFRRCSGSVAVCVVCVYVMVKFFVCFLKL